MSETPIAGRRATRRWTDTLYKALKAAQISAVSYIPDEGAGPLIDACESDSDMLVITVTREEEAVGVLTGAYLGGRRGALLMQASGLGNSLNALASVNVSCGVPILMVIGERGGLGEFNPCQTPGGRATAAFLEAIGVSVFRIDDDEDIETTISGAATLCFSTQQPVGVILGTMMQRSAE